MLDINNIIRLTCSCITPCFSPGTSSPRSLSLTLWFTSRTSPPWCSIYRWSIPLFTTTTSWSCCPVLSRCSIFLHRGPCAATWRCAILARGIFTAPSLGWCTLWTGFFLAPTSLASSATRGAHSAAWWRRRHCAVLLPEKVKKIKWTWSW